tara:strand:- start:19 stop:159 length:141 start_codon:yes stop_codon:yes gene_type:complete
MFEGIIYRISKTRKLRKHPKTLYFMVLSLGNSIKKIEQRDLKTRKH